MLTQEDDVEIHALARRRWSVSAIARHSGRDRKTVAKYVAGKAPVRARAPSCLEPFRPYLEARFNDDAHVLATVLYAELVGLGSPGPVGRLAPARQSLAKRLAHPSDHTTLTGRYRVLLPGPLELSAANRLQRALRPEAAPQPTESLRVEAIARGREVGAGENDVSSVAQRGRTLPRRTQPPVRTPAGAHRSESVTFTLRVLA